MAENSPSQTENALILGEGRPTIYGNYVAPALASPNSHWHIQGEQPDRALCGKRLTGDLRRMNLGVALLECSACMAVGATHPSCTPVTSTGSACAEETNR